MRSTVAIMLFLFGTAGFAIAQSGSSSGPSAPSAAPSAGPKASAPPSVTPGTTPPPGTAVPTPSQQNLDIAPPGRNLPPGGQGNAVTPQPPAAATPVPPQNVTAQPGQEPPAGSSRPQPGGANSSLPSRENRTGKNPVSANYSSCLTMWDAGTHMNRTEWTRACRRVDDRLKNLKVGDLNPAIPPLSKLKTEGGARP